MGCVVVAEREPKHGRGGPPALREDPRRLLMAVRASQFLFLVIFAFGMAWSFTEIADILRLPVSGFALGCSMFGAEGVIASEFMIQRLEARLAASQ